MAPKNRAKGGDSKKKSQDKSQEKTQATNVSIGGATWQPKKPIVEILGNAFAILALAALGSPISQMNLSPVYGSIPAAIHHQKGIMLAAMIAYIAVAQLRSQNMPINAKNYISPMAYYVPVLQSLLFKYSTVLGPERGPFVTELLTYFPVLLLSLMGASEVLSDLNLTQYGTRVAEATPAIASYFAYSAMVQGANSFLPQIMGTSDFFTRSGLQLLVATISGVLFRSTMMALAVPAVLHTMFQNPHHYATRTTQIVNHTLAESQYSLLARADSVTGYISVLENHKDGFRLLRCDHSILGGEWTITPERKKTGQTVKETIYAVFTMLEAVRLIKTPIFVPDDERDALFIGLGIGTAPTAFITHGINTTIVEIDPVVHDYATKYFSLPTNHTKVIADATTWVDSQAKAAPESYDYIIHDVFTGGAEPIALFTYEFLQGLNTLLKEDGAIAINYAGDIDLPPPRIVLNTIFAVFPNCRIYRDTLPDDPETFINMIVFCTKTLAPLEFRLATNDDYLDSMARRAYLPPDDGLEIHLPNIGGGERKYTEVDMLKRGQESEVAEYHDEAAIKHWVVMRKVMPAAVWENW
ncbi:spermine/spermidine synthase [Microthyrium microscopicum]|uniref:Spermine/spermidine synthase n=1 Tax=Microthyrium microscopicum TaxID=703497 RepID=A0A6A6TWE6_9PEZI|nr:spermine/spermidine synthase [Microthyrium microscopicum]